MRAHGTIPLITPWWIPLVIPLLPEEPSPVPESLLLTWNPSFACGAIPVHSGPRLLVNWPLPPSPFPPHSHFPPWWFPIPIMCPSTMTSLPRLHIAGYTFLWGAMGKNKNIRVRDYRECSQGNGMNACRSLYSVVVTNQPEEDNNSQH